MILSQPVLAFTVPGAAVPQGSLIPVWPRYAAKCPACKRGLGRSLLIANNDRKLRPWRKTVTTAARAAVLAAQLTGPVEWPLQGPVWVSAAYTFVRPASHKPDSWPIGKGSVGDIDKLIRATYDSLTGVVFGDDAQVVAERATKVYGPAAKVRILVGVVLPPSPAGVAG